MKAIASIIFFTLFAGLLPAATRAETALPPGSEAPDFFTAGIRMAGVLILVIGGLLLVLYLARRAANARVGLFGGQELIRVLATKPLAPKKYLAVVEVGDSVLTLGVSADSINCLDKQDAGSFHESRPSADRSAEAPSFAGTLKGLAGLTAGRGKDQGR